MDILKTLLTYAEKDDNIRAVLMEGSRAFGTVDRYSDYDIVYVTQSSEPYFGGAVLPFLTDSFGEIAIMQTPDNGDPHDVYTHLVQFKSGLRIDLTFNSIAFLDRTPLESATAILLDKDGRFANTAPPSDADFWLKRPTAAQYRRHCNEFYWCSPYVAKAVARGQTLHALAILGEPIRAEYLIMLSFLAGARSSWEHVNAGKHGANIRSYLPPDEAHYYDTLKDSYVHANDEEIMRALDALMTEYAALAAAVADTLDYRFDAAEADRTIRFINERFVGKPENDGTQENSMQPIE